MKVFYKLSEFRTFKTKWAYIISSLNKYIQKLKIKIKKARFLQNKKYHDFPISSVKLYNKNGYYQEFFRTKSYSIETL